MLKTGHSQRRPAPGPDSGLDHRTRQLGIDLSLIDENLRLTPLERMRQHDQSVRQILAVRQRIGIIEEHES